MSIRAIYEPSGPAGEYAKLTTRDLAGLPEKIELMARRAAASPDKETPVHVGLLWLMHAAAGELLEMASEGMSPEPNFKEKLTALGATVEGDEHCWWVEAEDGMRVPTRNERDAIAFAAAHRKTEVDTTPDTRPTREEWEGTDGGASAALEFCLAQLPRWGFHANRDTDPQIILPEAFETQRVHGASTWASVVSAACKAAGIPAPFREWEPEPAQEWEPPGTCVACEEWLHERGCPAASIRLLAASLHTIQDACRWVHERETTQAAQAAGEGD